MVLVLGVSAGAGGARALLTHSDQPHLDPIDRCHIPRTADSGVADPVCTAIRRMHAAAARRDELITGAAVACRNGAHAGEVRSAAPRGTRTVVDERQAQLRYLRFTGALPDSGSVLLYDLGSSGLTLTQVDCRTDTVLACTRSTVLGSDSHDTLLRWQLTRGGTLPETSTEQRHSEASNRNGGVDVVTAPPLRTEARTVITGNDLAELCAAGLHHSVSLVRQLIDETSVPADAVVLLGGCSRSPGIRAELTEYLELPVIYDHEPEYVSARGAVLLATERPRARMSRIGAGGQLSRPVPVGRRKLIAAATVTLGLGATVAGLLGTKDAPMPPTEGESPAPMQVVGIPHGPGR